MILPFFCITLLLQFVLYFKTKYVLFKPTYKLLLLTGLHIILIDLRNFWDSKPWPPYPRFLIKKRECKWLEVGWGQLDGFIQKKTTLLNPYFSRFYGTNCWPVLDIEYISCSFTLCWILYFFTSEIAMVTYITEVFKSKTDVLMTGVCLMIQVGSGMFLLDEEQVKFCGVVLKMVL